MKSFFLSEIPKKADLVLKKPKFKFVLVNSLLAGSQKGATTLKGVCGASVACRRDGSHYSLLGFQAVLYYEDF